ncbi:HK97 family phage major capsid protein [Planifilum fimeticola]|uniref:HK97 family phage major capsid protein n=1 Tax=Planifilum fimeticola TaxID=201975 RepID=A0A2T0LC19_9BACL|nr:phage major capsid protein [Planifilum fimeticola]PRX39516.1 HK97 family phage major capsid protein [Planifilum fimeticola]
MPTLYDLKEKLATVGNQLKNVEEQLVDKAANPAVTKEEIEELKNKKADLQQRFELLKEQHDKVEKEQQAKIKQENPISVVENEEGKLIAAKAELIRAAIQNRPMSEEAMNVLRALPAPQPSGGEKLLPTTMTDALVYEPFARNPLRDVIRMSNIRGLEVPKIAYTLDDDAFIGDDETAKELALTGDKVSFGRHKFKVKATISDTVLHGSDLNLVNYVENALRSGLAAKEKKVSFATTPATGEEHMSFYSTQNNIKEVSGADLYEAITQAIADLHEDFRENARVCMTYADYVRILQTLSNGSAVLFNAPPESIIGKPVVFSDSATTPIVGDFNYVHLNYDGPLVYDTDKDVNTGDYLFVITAWIDQHILLKSAFRRAKVVPVG